MKIKMPKCNLKCPNWANKYWVIASLSVAVFILAFGVGGYYIKSIQPYWVDFLSQTGIIKNQVASTTLPVKVIPYNPQTTQEEAIINVVKNASSAAVSIIISICRMGSWFLTVLVYVHAT